MFFDKKSSTCYGESNAYLRFYLDSKTASWVVGGFYNEFETLDVCFNLPVNLDF